METDAKWVICMISEAPSLMANTTLQKGDLLVSLTHLFHLFHLVHRIDDSKRWLQDKSWLTSILSQVTYPGFLPPFLLKSTSIFQLHPQAASSGVSSLEPRDLQVHWIHSANSSTLSDESKFKLCCPSLQMVALVTTISSAFKGSCKTIDTRQTSDSLCHNLLMNCNMWLNKLHLGNSQDCLLLQFPTTEQGNSLNWRPFLYFTQVHLFHKSRLCTGCDFFL